MRNFIFAISVLFILGSCAAFKEPELVKMGEFKMGQIEGKHINFTVDATVHNPNWYALKVKKSHVEVYVEDQFMGNVYLDKKIKMKAKRDSELIADLHAELEDGAMITALRYAKKEDVKVHIKGKIKGGIFIFSKKFEIDETRSISGKELRLGMPK